MDSGFKPDSCTACYQRFLEGDESGFDELVKDYGEKLIFFINRFVNDYALAEDLMEDTFCEILIHRNRFRGRSSFQSYLFGIAHNKAVDAVRKSRRTVNVEHPEAWIADDIASFEEGIYANQRSAALHKALGSLCEDYRAAIHLVYFEEMSYNEAAAILKKNSRQIKNLIYRAKQALKELMKGEAIFNEDFPAAD